MVENTKISYSRIALLSLSAPNFAILVKFRLFSFKNLQTRVILAHHRDHNQFHLAHDGSSSRPRWCHNDSRGNFLFFFIFSSKSRYSSFFFLFFYASYFFSIFPHICSKITQLKKMFVKIM